MIRPENRIGTAEVAARFGVSRSYVAAQCRAGRFPCLCVGGRYRFTTGDLSAIAAMLRRLPHDARSSRSPVRLAWGDLPAGAELTRSKPRRAAINVRRFPRFGDG